MADGYIGDPVVIDHLLVALIAGGHALLEGVPGVAKTTVAKRFADTLGGSFNRIQFTQDLLPGDVTGSQVFNMQTREFELHPGPIFANVVLGDEINRAPPKAQSALLEAMQERQVTIDGKTLSLPDPFLVLATRNPTEQTGVYPLPEAQIDRFLIRIRMEYPSLDDEIELLSRWSESPPRPRAWLDSAQIIALRRQALSIHVSADINRYIAELAAESRQDTRVQLGASPRAALALLLACRARALLDGRDHVLPDDVRALIQAVWAHRIVLNLDAQMAGLGGEHLIDEWLRSIEFKGPANT